jgi:hypothetical protein
MAAILGGIVDRARMAITDGFDLLLLVTGAGTAGLVTGLIRKYVPQIGATITDEMLASAIGFLLFYFGGRIHRRLVPFGLGVFVAGLGSFVGGLVGKTLAPYMTA